MKKTFGALLRDNRALKGWSQPDAAGRIPGLSVRTYQAWEIDRVTPPVWCQNLILAKLKAGVK